MPKPPSEGDHHAFPFHPARHSGAGRRRRPGLPGRSLDPRPTAAVARGGDARRRGTAAGLRHARAGGARRQAVDPHRARLCSPHRGHPRHRPPGEGVGLRGRAAGARRRRRQGGRPAVPARPAGLPGGARRGQRRHRARPGHARLPARQLRPRRRPVEERLYRQGQPRPAHERAAPGRGRPDGRPGDAARGAAQPRLHGHPRAVSGPARPQFRRRSARWRARARRC